MESFLSNNTSNCSKFIIISTSGKNLLPPPQKLNDDLYLPENQELQTTCSCNLCQVNLKSRQVTGDSKDAKGATSEVNICYLQHLIKPQIIH